MAKLEYDSETRQLEAALAAQCNCCELCVQSRVRKYKDKRLKLSDKTPHNKLYSESQCLSPSLQNYQKHPNTKQGLECSCSNTNNQNGSKDYTEKLDKLIFDLGREMCKVRPCSKDATKRKSQPEKFPRSRHKHEQRREHNKPNRENGEGGTYKRKFDEPFLVNAVNNVLQSPKRSSIGHPSDLSNEDGKELRKDDPFTALEENQPCEIVYVRKSDKESALKSEETLVPMISMVSMRKSGVLYKHETPFAAVVSLTRIAATDEGGSYVKSTLIEDVERDEGNTVDRIVAVDRRTLVHTKDNDVIAGKASLQNTVIPMEKSLLFEHFKENQTESFARARVYFEPEALSGAPVLKYEKEAHSEGMGSQNYPTTSKHPDDPNLSTVAVRDDQTPQIRELLNRDKDRKKADIVIPPYVITMLEANEGDTCDCNEVNCEHKVTIARKMSDTSLVDSKKSQETGDGKATAHGPQLAYPDDPEFKTLRKQITDSFRALDECEIAMDDLNKNIPSVKAGRETSKTSKKNDNQPRPDDRISQPKNTNVFPMVIQGSRLRVPSNDQTIESLKSNIRERRKQEESCLKSRKWEPKYDSACLFEHPERKFIRTEYDSTTHKPLPTRYHTVVLPQIDSEYTTTEAAPKFYQDRQKPSPVKRNSIGKTPCEERLDCCQPVTKAIQVDFENPVNQRVLPRDLEKDVEEAVRFTNALDTVEFPGAGQKRKKSSPSSILQDIHDLEKIIDVWHKGKGFKEGKVQLTESDLRDIGQSPVDSSVKQETYIEKPIDSWDNEAVHENVVSKHDRIRESACLVTSTSDVSSKSEGIIPELLDVTKTKPSDIYIPTTPIHSYGDVCVVETPTPSIGDVCVDVTSDVDEASETSSLIELEPFPEQSFLQKSLQFFRAKRWSQVRPVAPRYSRKYNTGINDTSQDLNE